MTAEARKVDLSGDALDGVWDELAVLETAPPPSFEPGERKGPTVAGRYSEGAIIAGKYQLSTVLGEGGMGSVWVAKNRTLDVDVAIKLMRPELSEDVEGIAERMLQEARAAAGIGHPAIIQVFDFGYSELGDPFIAMELLRGESLSQTLRRRQRLSPIRAAQTLLPVVDALLATHARGIVHRDLKPENIFLTRLSGRRLQPKVLDFGIAKLEQRAAERLTRDGAVIGSPAYMAPEQLRGEASVDGRVDVWALCVVLYQMLVGKRPFDGDNYHASMWNVAHSPPPPIAEQGVDEPELWDILQRGLTKDPKARTPDMRCLGRELAGWLLSRGVNEDISEASLRAWFVDQESQQGQLHSFFPSQEPAARVSLQPELQAFSLGSMSVESSGTRRIEPVATPQTARPSWFATTPQWLWLTASAAGLAFAGALVWSVTVPTHYGEPKAESRTSPRTRLLESMSARKPTKPPIAEDGVHAAPAARASAAAPRDEETYSSSEDSASRVVPRVSAQPKRAPVKPARPRPTKSDLKNPFE